MPRLSQKSMPVWPAVANTGFGVAFGSGAPPRGFPTWPFPLCISDAPPRPLPRCHLLCPGYTFRCVSAAAGHPVVRRGCRCRARPGGLALWAPATGMCHADGSAGSCQVECPGPLHRALGARSSRGSPRNGQILLARVSCLGSCCYSPRGVIYRREWFDHLLLLWFCFLNQDSRPEAGGGLGGCWMQSSLQG